VAKTPDPQAVRELAYQLWQKREPFEGDAQSDWTRAEEMLLNDATLRSGREQQDAPAPPDKHTQQQTDQTVKESFPASDPPATHFPDVPPVNADAKWAAAKAAERGAVPPTLPGRNTPAPGKNAPPAARNAPAPGRKPR
jgi:hypothetical protein